MSAEYKGPDSIGWATFPGKGRGYFFEVEGHRIQLHVSEKAKRVRVFVDGKERQ